MSWNNWRSRAQDSRGPSDIEKLTQLFEQLGAKDPRQWASSQVNEGTPQLARYLFLRQAWRLIMSDASDAWIAERIREYEANPLQPLSGVGKSLQSLRNKNATPDELTDLIRGVQVELLLQLCYLLEDPGDIEEEVQDVAWGLFLLDGKGRPTTRVSGLHESVLATDPLGTEMRPRNTE